MIGRINDLFCVFMTMAGRSRSDRRQPCGLFLSLEKFSDLIWCLIACFWNADPDEDGPYKAYSGVGPYGTVKFQMLDHEAVDQRDDEVKQPHAGDANRIKRRSDFRWQNFGED